MTGAVEWSRGPDDSTTLLALTHLLAGATVVLAVGAVAVFARFVWRQATAGDPTLAGVAVVLVLVGSWASLAYLVPVLADARLRQELATDPAVQGLRPSWVVLTTVAVWILVAGAATLGAPVSIAAMSAFVVPFFLWVVLQAEGRVDPAGPTVRTRHREVTVEGMTGSRSLGLGSLTVFWCSYARGRGGLDAPHLLVVPQSSAPDVRRALEAIADPDADPDPGDPGERLAVAAAGTACLLVAVSALVAPVVVDLPPAVHVLALPAGLLGVVFLAAAWVE